MVILTAGSSGLLGTALRRALSESGWEHRQLVRREPAHTGEVGWDPTCPLPQDVLDGVSTVINLGGAGVGDRPWTRSRRQVLHDSRIIPTTTLTQAVVRRRRTHDQPIRLLQASAAGWYGEGGEQELTETLPAGSTEMAALCHAWEAAVEPARAAGAQVVTLRTGIVLSSAGGALAPMMPLLKLGLAGPLGSGQQWWPWIHEHDWVRAVLMLISSEHTGPVNLSAPSPERNRTIIRALAAATHRPAVVRAPRWALRLALGGFGAEITRSQRMVPHVLTGLGYEFEYDQISDAAAAVMTRPDRPG